MKPGRILYLHGFASGPGSKKAQRFRERFLEKGIELEIPDLTQDDFEHLTITAQLRVVEGVARGDVVSLMGSSMGGYLAALYAARHPEVKQLVLMAPGFAFARRFVEYLGPGQAAEWERTGWFSFFNYAAGAESRVWWKLIEDARQYEDYPLLTQPTTIFHGLRDDVVPCALSQEFIRRCPIARLELVDSDHELLSAFEDIWKSVAEWM